MMAASAHETGPWKMLLLKPSHARHPTYKVIGLVLILPLMISLLGLDAIGVLLAIATSTYGVWFAAQHASRGLTATAAVITLLNVVSMLMLSTPSVLMALGYIAWFYAYPPVSEWLYWRR